MKICRYIKKNSYQLEPRLGILLEDRNIIVDPNLVYACDFQRDGRYDPYNRANHYMPTSLNFILNFKPDPLELLHESYGLYLFLEKIGDLETLEGNKIFIEYDDSVKLCNPMDKISNYRAFYSHEKHVKSGYKKRKQEVPDEWYKRPVYYKGITNGFIGHEDEILWPKYTNILDYELELGMVIGKGGKNIFKKKAVDHIFGFTILNDVSARDIQKKEMSVRMGPSKGKDFCSVLGPVITTIDEFDYKEPSLLMTASVNGEEWSRGYSSESHFSWSEMIEYVSMDEWITPGDLFGSGTVGTGCGFELDRWVKSGDEIELSIESIGVLKNTIGRKTLGKL